MNVIIVSDFAVPSGGSQKVAIESARGLAEAGVSVHFVHAVAERDACLDHPLITGTCLDLPDIWDRPLAQAAVAGIWNRAPKRRLAALFAAAPPRSTILHIHQWTRAFSPSLFEVALASRLPVVVTTHDYFLSCPNGVYYRFDRQRPCVLRPLSPACLVAGCDPKSAAHKAIRVLRSAATALAISGKKLDVVHVSDRGRETLVPLLPAGLIHHRIDNPVAVAQGDAASIDEDAGFLFIGRLTREKGAVIAAAAARIAGVPITFVGDGPAAAEIRAENADAELLGWCPREEIAALLKGRTKAVVAPSQWLETGPLTVYEAAAAGVASIVSDRCGAAERVDHEVSGLMVEPTVDGVADALRRLNDATIARRFGETAYKQYWARPPTPDAHARALIALYAEILGRPE